MLLYGKKVKQWTVQKLLLALIWNYQQLTVVTRSFCWHQNFVSWGVYAPCPGAIIMKKMYKIRLRFLWNLQQMGKGDKAFLLTSNFCPLGGGGGAVCPAPGLFTCIQSWKQNCIKSDFKEMFLKHATHDRSNKMFLLTSKFLPQGVVSPCPGAIYIYKLMKKMYKIRLQRDLFSIL